MADDLTVTREGDLLVIRIRRARTPLRTYLSTLVFGATVAMLLMLLNVAFLGSAGVHALGLLPGLYVATLEFRLFVTPPAPPRT